MTSLFTRLPTRTARWIRLLGLASVVGLLAGLAAAALEYGLHEGSRILVGRFTNLGGAHILTFRPAPLLLPALGGLAVGLLVHWLCQRLAGHGTDLLIGAFHRRRGILPLRAPLVNATAAIGVISCGGDGRPGADCPRGPRAGYHDHGRSGPELHPARPNPRRRPIPQYCDAVTECQYGVVAGEDRAIHGASERWKGCPP